MCLLLFLSRDVILGIKVASTPEVIYQWYLLVVQRTLVNLIGLVQEKYIIISGLSEYPVTIFY